MANLYEINTDIENLINTGLTNDEMLVDNETGEVISVGELLNQLEIDQKTKLDNIGCMIKNLKSDIDAMKQEEQKLSARRKARENMVERLKNYVIANLQYAGYKKFESARVVLTLKASESVEVDENAELPEQFVNVKITQTPNKTMIKDALKEGAMIEGCRIVENTNLLIR